MQDCKISECQLTQSCQVCRLVCLQLVLFGPYHPWSWWLVPSAQNRLRWLSFDQNSAQIRFTLSSDCLRHSLSPDLDQVQNQFSSGSAQFGCILSQLRSSSAQLRIRFRSGSHSSQLKSSSAQLRFMLRSEQVRLRSGSD